MRQFFSSSPGIRGKVGPQFESLLVSNNNHEESQDVFNFLDYYPLVNARALRMGGMSSSPESKQWILNENLRATYKKFVFFLVAKKYWNAHDRMMFVNYLLMQERVTEAVSEFRKIADLSDIYGEAQLQHDYIKAYLDFYECGRVGSLDFAHAREVVARYKAYPVLQ